MELSSLFFAAIAGIITITSPCVLPILPIILSSALKKNKWYPVLMVLGLSITFSFLGVLFGTFGRSLSFTRDSLNDIAIVILFLMGLVILSEKLNAYLNRLIQPIVNKFSSAAGSTNGESWWGAIFLGAVMGVVWAPCAGPILASILALATSTQSAVSGFILLFIYSIGAGIPMLILAYGGQRAFKGSRLVVGQSRTIKKIFGWILIITAVMLYFGLFKKIEAALIPYLPDFISLF